MSLDPAQHAADLRDAAEWLGVLHAEEHQLPARAHFADLANRLTASAAAIEAALESGDPSAPITLWPEVARMEPVEVVSAYTPFPHNLHAFIAWRFAARSEPEESV